MLAFLCNLLYTGYFGRTPEVCVELGVIAKEQAS